MIEPFSFDLFASRLNHKVSSYSAWKPDPRARFIDAFSVYWSSFGNLRFSSIQHILTVSSEDSTRTLLRDVNDTSLADSMLASESKVSADRCASGSAQKCTRSAIQQESASQTVQAPQTSSLATVRRSSRDREIP